MEAAPASSLDDSPPPALDGEFLLVLNNADMAPPVVDQHFSMDLEFLNGHPVDFQTVTVDVEQSCFRLVKEPEDFALPSGGQRRQSVEFTASQHSSGAPLELRIITTDSHGAVRVYHNEEPIKIPVRRAGTKKIHTKGDMSYAEVAVDPDEDVEVYAEGEGAQVALTAVSKGHKRGFQVGGGEKLMIRLVYHPDDSARVAAKIRRAKTISHDLREGELVFRQPVEDLGAFTHVSVQESQEAVLVRNGQLLDLFGPGLHAMTAENLPQTRAALNGHTARPPVFNGEMYFVNKTTRQNVDWGVGGLMFREPHRSIPVKRGANGVMQLRAEDSRTLLAWIIAHPPCDPKDAVWAKSRDVIKKLLPSAIEHLNIGSVDLDSHKDRLEEQLRRELPPELLKEGGLAMESFEISGFDVPKPARRWH